MSHLTSSPLARVHRLICLGAIVAMAACSGTNETDPSKTPSSNTLTATIDGKSFSSVATIALHSPATPGLPNGTLGVSGTDKFTTPYTLLAFAVPFAAGSYPLASATAVPQNAAVTNINSGATGAQWNAGGAANAPSGTITVSTLTSNSASGTFSFTAVPQSGSGSTGNKVVTSGVFNVTF